MSSSIVIHILASDMEYVGMGPIRSHVIALAGTLMPTVQQVGYNARQLEIRISFRFYCTIRTDRESKKESHKTRRK